MITFFLLVLAVIAVAIWKSSESTPLVQASTHTPTVRNTTSGFIRYANTSKTIPRPTTQAGDVLLLFLAADYGVHTETQLPSGFTEIGRRAFATNRLAYIVGYKIATGSEPASYTYTTNSLADSMYSMSSIQNADTTMAPVISNTNTGDGSGNHSAPSMTPPGVNDLLLSSVALDSFTFTTDQSTGADIPNLDEPLGQNTWTTAAGMTKITDVQVDNYDPPKYMMSMIVATESLTTSGEAGVKTFRSQAERMLAGFGYSVVFKGLSDTKVNSTPQAVVAAAPGTGWQSTTPSAISEGETLNTSTIGTGLSTSSELRYTTTSPNVPSTNKVTQYELRVCAYSATTGNGGSLDNLAIAFRVNGSIKNSTTVTPPYSTSATACTWYSTVYSGTWPASETQSFEIGFTPTVVGSGGGNSNKWIDDVRINSAYVRTIHHPVKTGSTTSYVQPTVRAYTSANHTSAVSSKTIARPTVQAGDLLVAIFVADKGLMREMAMPAGFTEVAWLDRGLGAIHTKVATKVATGSEPTSYSYSASSDSNTRFDMIAVQNADTSAAPVITRNITPVARNDFHVPSVDPTGANDLLLMALARTSSPTTGAMGWVAESGSGVNFMGITQSSNVLSLMTAQKTLTSGASTPRFKFTSDDASGGGAVGYSQPTVKLASATTTSKPMVSLSVARPDSSFGGVQLAQASTLSSEPATAFSMAIKGATPAVVEQANYRLYANQDDATGGAPLAANNTSATVPAQTPFRLRQLIRQVDGTTLAASAFKLQAAEKAGSCSASTFSDGLAQFYDIPAISDEQTAVSRTDDPTVSGGAIVYQQVSENAATTAGAAITAGNSGLWEFSLTSGSDWAGKTYCFRLVKSDGTAFSNYAQYAEVSFTAPAPSGATLDQQLRGGQSVVDGQKNPYSW